MPSGASPRATMVSATRVCAAIASFGAAACHAPSFSSAALAYLPTGTWRTSPTAIELSPTSLARSKFGPIATLSSLESFGAISTSWLPSRLIVSAILSPPPHANVDRRRSAPIERYAHCDTRRAPKPLYDARQDSKEGHDNCGGHARQTHPQTARGAATLPDVGPRQGDVWPQALHGCHQRAGLLLRSAQSLAARQQREHQRPAATVL